MEKRLFIDKIANGYLITYNCLINDEPVFCKNIEEVIKGIKDFYEKKAI